MKRTSISLIHFVIAAATLILSISLTEAQSYPKAGQKVEMVPYRLSATYDGACYLDIDIVEPYSFNNMVEAHSEEVKEILLERIVYEIVNPYSQNELFTIDGRYYYLIRLPHTGEIWHISY